METILNILLLATIASLLAWAIYKMPKRYYLGEIKEYKPSSDVTTVIPVPIHAATCDHDWDTISEQTLEMPHEKKFVSLLKCTRCGMLDKTVQTTSPPPPAPKPPPPPPCLHDWQVVIEQSMEMSHEKRVLVVLTCRKCGIIDKTTECTTPIPKRDWIKADCRHNWDVEKKVTLDSAYEQMLKSITVKTGYNGKKIDPNKELGLDLDKAPAWMFRKTSVSVRVCKTCGEVDKIIASNFDVGEDPTEEEEQTLKLKKGTA